MFFSFYSGDRPPAWQSFIYSTRWKSKIETFHSCVGSGGQVFCSHLMQVYTNLYSFFFFCSQLKNLFQRILYGEEKKNEFSQGILFSVKVSIRHGDLLWFYQPEFGLFNKTAKYSSLSQWSLRYMYFLWIYLFAWNGKLKTYESFIINSFIWFS